MQVNVSSEVHVVLDDAAKISIRNGHYFVGVEHLFEALARKTELLPPEIVRKYQQYFDAVRRELERTAWRGGTPDTRGEVFYTPRCGSITNEATRLAERMRNGNATAGHLLLAMLIDPLSATSRALDGLDLNRSQFIQDLRDQLASSNGARPARAERKAPARPSGAEDSPSTVSAPVAVVSSEQKSDQEKALERITRDLTDVARTGKIEPVIGRKNELMELLQILARKSKSNAIIVGEAGVGKTKVVEGLALEIVKDGAGGFLEGFRILELDVGALMSGTQYRGAFEEKLLGLIEELKRDDKSILFIDEIHLIMGAGATDGDGMDAANLLKPALARGEIKCLGATTLSEYRKFIERDPAIERRFQMIRVPELSEAATAEVLKRYRPTLEKHHGVVVGSRAIQASIQLTQRYLPNRRLPDKAIDILDQACARYRLKAMTAKRDPEALKNTIMPTKANKVTPHDVRKVVSQLAGVPLEDMTAEERLLMQDLEQVLRRRIIGQDEAVNAVASAVKKSRAGLADPNRPDAVMLFLGPSGVGKTELAKALADIVFGSSNHLNAFDMSEFIEEHSVSKLIGSPPGYQGTEEEGRLVRAAKNAPFSIMLFDEVEKAHPRIFDIFLPMLDEGRMRDARGNEVSFKNHLIIFTSNIGAEKLYRAGSSESGADLIDELRGHFRPEFINRIDNIVPFYPLLFEDVRTILKKNIDELRRRLRDKQISIRMYQRAYEYLAEKGYNPQFGARELRRCIDREVITPISDHIINGKFKAGDIIDIKIEDDKLCFEKGQPSES